MRMRDGTRARDKNEELEEWLRDRPQAIRDLARSHPPDAQYRLASGTDGDVYQIYSYFEDGTMSAIRYTRLTPDSMMPLWRVFGMKPEDLVKVDD
jgi:hypothetical protein